MNDAGEPITIGGRCHCGAVRFEATLSEGLATAKRCNCSLCRIRGAVAVSAALGGVSVLAGGDVLTSYRFDTGVAEHFFCSRCGIYTRHERRSNPNEFGVNVACLDGLSPFDFREIPVFDGVHHSKDHGGRVRRVGVLRFERDDAGERPAPDAPHLQA